MRNLKVREARCFCWCLFLGLFLGNAEPSLGLLLGARRTLVPNCVLLTTNNPVVEQKAWWAVVSLGLPDITRSIEGRAQSVTLSSNSLTVKLLSPGGPPTLGGRCTLGLLALFFPTQSAGILKLDVMMWQWGSFLWFRTCPSRSFFWPWGSSQDDLYVLILTVSGKAKGHCCVALIAFSVTTDCISRIPEQPRLIASWVSVGEPSRHLLVATTPPDQSKAVRVIVLLERVFTHQSPRPPMKRFSSLGYVSQGPEIVPHTMSQVITQFDVSPVVHENFEIRTDV